jgi:hypothetical protein
MRGMLVGLAIVAVSCSGAAEQSTVVSPTAAPTTAIVPPPTSPKQPTTTIGAPIPTAGTSVTTTTAVPTPERAGWFVVWVTGWLPDGFTDDLRAIPGVDVVSEVWVGNAEVIATRDRKGEIVDEPPPGFVLPVELHAVDADAHAAFVPAEVAALVADLKPRDVLLGESSARLRRLGPGSTVTLSDGAVLRVAGVVPDRWVGAGEMLTTASDFSELGADRSRYAVVGYNGIKQELLLAANGITDLGMRVWAEDEVDVFRHADAVLPQVTIKLRFGEFAYRPLGRGRIEIDPDWVAAHIVTVDLPLIGTVQCHRDFIAALEIAMQAIAESNTPGVVTRGSDSGCFNQRFIAGRRDLSRHAWGVAIDINWGNSRDAVRSPVAPELLAATAAAGITSGHDWINPDPGHFEWVGAGN